MKDAETKTIPIAINIRRVKMVIFAVFIIPDSIWNVAVQYGPLCCFSSKPAPFIFRIHVLYIQTFLFSRCIEQSKWSEELRTKIAERQSLTLQKKFYQSLLTRKKQLAIIDLPGQSTKSITKEVLLWRETIKTRITKNS